MHSTAAWFDKQIINAPHSIKERLNRHGRANKESEKVLLNVNSRQPVNALVDINLLIPKVIFYEN